MPGVAFVYAFPTRAEEFFPDVLLSLCSSDCRRAGVDSRVFKLYYDPDDEAANHSLARRTVDRLVEGDRRVVVFERLWDADLIADLRRRAPWPVHVILASESDCAPMPGVDVVVRKNHRRAVAALVAAALRGELPREAPLADRPADDDEPRPTSPTSTTRSSTRVWLCRSGARSCWATAGCAYAHDAGRNPLFDGIDLAHPDMARQGCTFCPMGGDHVHRDAAASAERVLHQVRYLTDRLPDIEEIQIYDQHPLPYLEALVRRSAQTGVRRLSYLFMDRADWVLRGRDQLVRALRACRETGFRLVNYLIGFETFAPHDLAVYNKGVTPRKTRCLAVPARSRASGLTPSASAATRRTASSCSIRGARSGISTRIPGHAPARAGYLRRRFTATKARLAGPASARARRCGRTVVRRVSDGATRPIRADGLLDRGPVAIQGAGRGARLRALRRARAALAGRA